MTMIRSGLPCQECGSRDNGAVYRNVDETGEPFYLFKCFGGACGHTKRLESFEGNTLTTEPKQAITGLLPTGSYVDLRNAEHAWGNRNIEADTCQYFGVSVLEDCPLTQNQQQKMSLINNQQPTTGSGLVLPYFDDKGNCIAQKVRTSVNKKGSWYKADDNALKRIGFFGQQLWKSNNIRDIVVTFGELDALAVYQMLGVPVVSISNGDASAPAQFKAQYNWLQRFNNIILIPDNDESCQAVIPLLGSVFPRKIRIVSLPDYKDPNEYLQNHAREKFVNAFYAAQPFTPEKIISLGSLQNLLFEDPPTPVASYPWDGLNRLTGGVWPGELIACKAPPKVGKCFAKGTKLRMFDGSIKKVEDIKPRDMLMGDDCSGRRVAELAWGTDQMYEITQSNGETYTVNSAHILCLVNRKDYDDLVDISVEDYLKKPKAWRDLYRGYRVVTDPNNWHSVNNKALPPHMLGLWLGDGTTGAARITTGDTDLIPVFSKYARINKMKLSRYGKFDYMFTVEKLGANPFINALKKEKVFEDKHIPPRYKYASLEDRLDLLAGIVDSDGYLSTSEYEVVQRDIRLVNDIVELAQLCGFITKVSYTTRKKTMNNGKVANIAYYRIFIRGDIERIPVRVAHKRASLKNRISDRFLSKLTVKPVGKGEYYGFTLSNRSPNRRFLLADGTVVHNTTFFTEIASHLYTTTNKSIGLIYLEETQRDLIFRFVSIKLNKNLQRLDILNNVDKTELKTAAEELIADDRIFVVDHWGSCSSDFLEEKVKEFVLSKGCQFIFFDHISMAISDESNKDERLALDRLVYAIKALTVGVPDEESYLDETTGEIKTRVVTRQPTLFVITHVNDNGQPRGSRVLVQASNLVIGLQRDKMNEDANIKNLLRVFVEENRRYGETGLACNLNYNSATGRLLEVPVVEEFIND